MTERFSGARLSHFRMMVLREEFGEILWHVKHESNDNLRYIERLLSDDNVGVAPNAAEVAEGLARRGIDIERLVPALEKALENPYAKTLAARALAAHHRKRVNIRKLEAMLRHKDPQIRQAAEEIVSEEGFPGFEKD